jgi:hypothetical protein
VSQIITDLGWSCDSEYYVETSGTKLGTFSTGDNAYKAMSGAAIAARIYNGNSSQIFLASTSENNAKLKMDESLRTVYSVEVDGRNWYVSLSYMSSQAITSDYPLITASKGETLNDVSIENLIKVIIELTEAANVTYQEAAEIPTINYVHEYVEGVVRENNDILSDKMIGVSVINENLIFN